MADGLLQRVASGDQGAMDACIDQYGGLVWSLARRFLSERSEAEDAVQDIFVDVWKSAHRADPKLGSEATFIATIARRRLIDRIRKKTRAPGEVELQAGAFAGSGGSGDGSDPKETVEEATLAASAIKKLSGPEQEVLRLSVMHGLSHSRIAEATGMPLGTVKTHARRGLLKIRDILSGRGGERVVGAEA